jgi:RNA polymerase sigma-70 factor (ECF subfamily)
MNTEQEQLLVKRAQTGDRAALAMLYDNITPKLFGYLVNTLKDKILAEDLLQTTWLKAISALPQYQTRGAKFQAWLFAIARNECRQHWRKGQKEIGLDVTKFDVADKNEDQTQNNLLVEQVLNKLSQNDRELLRLRYIADLPLNNIARILNINFVAVRVRLHRALARARATVNS